MLEKHAKRLLKYIAYPFVFLAIFFFFLYLSPAVNRNPIPESILQTPHRVLVVLAHADDEVMSAGLLATLAKNSSTIKAIILTDGAANPNSDLSACPEKNIVACRIREVRESLQNIDVQDLVLPLYPDSKLSNYTDQAADFVAREIQNFRPTIIQTVEPSGLNGNQDHVAASRIALLAAQKASDNNAKILLTTLPFPISLFLPSKMPNKLKGNIAHLTLTDATIDLKVRSARAHRSQTSTLQGLSAFFGPKAIFRWAGRESFYILEAADLSLLH